MAYEIVPELKDRLVFGEQGAQPQILYLDGQIKVLLAGLEAGQSIPQHPEALSVYHFLEGEGVMTVDGEAVPVKAGTVLTLPHGTVRGLDAHSRVIFVAVRVAPLEAPAGAGAAAAAKS